MKENKNISDLETANLNVNSLDTDFRAEILAVELMEAGYDGEKIHILRQGGSRRTFSKDIEEVNLHFSEHNLKDSLQIKTNRDGIYDVLPEGIFHQPVHKKFNRDKEDILEEVKRHRMEEFYARKFFQVFEIQNDYALVQAYLYEMQFNKKKSDSAYTDIFIPYWPALKLLNPEQQVLFMETIPLIHQIRESNDEIEKTLSALLEVPVTIKSIKLPAKDAENYFESTLGESRLDADLVLGKTLDDSQPDLEITIGPVSSGKMVYFLKTSVGNMVFDFLCFLLLPGDTFIVKKFNIVPEDSIFTLGEEDTALGVNTFLYSKVAFETDSFNP